MILGDCLDIMREMEDNSIDFIVTDSPYGLNFMDKHWDGEIPSVEYWQEALRVCKPGSMLASFGGSRTHHHLMLAIERSGWEIRDVIMWIYGSGFPKSHNKFGFDGYGTALKPAYEPIIIAMKPLDGTFAQNAEKWGVGGINIESSRIGKDEITTQLRDRSAWHGNKWGNGGYEKPIGESESRQGRWPANIIFDEEAAQELDQMTENKIHLSGRSTSGNHQRSMFSGFKDADFGKRVDFEDNKIGASRFFYCAKASSSERNKGLEEMKWFDNLELVLHNGTSFTLEELWVLEDQNQNMNSDSEVSPEKDIFEALISNLGDKECCIISFGNNTSDQFPKTIKFTTSMGSKQTIELKTWSYYQHLSINDCIQDVLKTNQGNGSSLAENAGLKNILKRIFTKEKTESLLGVRNALKKMPCLTSVKEEIRKGNIHPTLKPISLMKYIITLLSPPGNPVLLDPFAGSGSTLIAAKELGIEAIGIEKESEYHEIATQRIKNWTIPSEQYQLFK